MQLFRYKNVKTVKYFKSEREWKWLVNNEKEGLHVKRSDNVHNECKNIVESYGHNMCEYESELEQVDNESICMLGVFVDGKLRDVEENNEFTEEETEISNDKISHQDIIKAMKKMKQLQLIIPLRRRVYGRVLENCR